MRKKWLTLFFIGLWMLEAFAAGCGTKGTDAAASMSGQAANGAQYEEIASEDMAADAGASEGASEEGAGLAGSVSAAGQQMGEKLIYTYRYSVETKAFDAFLEAISDKAAELGGYIEASTTDGSGADGGSRYANLTLRIPADAMEQMLSLVKSEANVTYQSVSSEDVTLQYVDMESHLKALRTEQETLLKLLEGAQKVEDVISLQSRLTDVRYEIESYESQLRTYDNRITYSTLYLDVSEVVRTTSVTGAQTSFWDEIRIRFGDSLYAVGQGARGAVIWFVGSLPILVPLAAVIGAALLLWRKKGKGRRFLGRRERAQKEAAKEAERQETEDNEKHE